MRVKWGMKVLKLKCLTQSLKTHTQNLLSLDEKKIGEGLSKERELM